MNPIEPPPQDAATLKAEKAKRNQDRLAAAITPKGNGSIGSRERYAPSSHWPLQPCDFKKWSSRDSMPIEQACFVLLGFEPPELDVLKFRQDTYNPTHEPTWEAPPDYHDVLQSLRVSIEHGNIPVKRIREGKYETKNVTLPDLDRWARPKGYAIAPEIESIIAKMGAGASAVPVQDTATRAPMMPYQTETKEQRQDRRLKDCEAAGLNFQIYRGRLPDGVTGVAYREGVTRQSFSADVKAALERRARAKSAGVTVHRA